MRNCGCGCEQQANEDEKPPLSRVIQTQPCIRVCWPKCSCLSLQSSEAGAVPWEAKRTGTVCTWQRSLVLPPKPNSFLRRRWAWWHGDGTVGPGCDPAGTARLPGSVGPKESKKLNVFPLEGSWKIFSVFKVPMAAV